ncbi:4-phosphopantoate--beta-alanine ligase [Methanospirillum hungatei]|jgi:4-phosphopantoate--beta-alanine ligase|uniref:4-phosphopantoate--beta-alanine ligase n=1 Tax=Methanospirillum hungatei TaxID=2203 RepID=UPI001B5C9992|nr:4-phosphopantoate--beta-alanine ligase [Methanospirillum hungatei]MBP9007781.1 phosphopantothenate/pantothenate synthetase [Methanospirillum sp.]HOW06015.1 4-phosphopantoate--beta-alanine ligase [Methanospirillum hungatei]
MIPESHPRYKSLVTREKLAQYTKTGIVSLEGLTAHGRGEAFDYLLGEETTESALRAEKIAAALLLSANHPVISVNGNTAALAAKEIAQLQQASQARVEVNLFHRTEERVQAISDLLQEHGITLVEGAVSRYIPLDHDRGLCHYDGMHSADVVLVPLEDGDRAQALIDLGKKVIAIDLNPLSRTSKVATVPIIDEVTRALVNITGFCTELGQDEITRLTEDIHGTGFIRDALENIRERLLNVLD